uniref:Venom CUB domain protein 6 n=1 Tax=Platymeris rhadamanthus TaxID=1134088 RepID=A0A6B9KZ49_PLARH|nr:venom CUB domain protein 6 [Platymeris rhadamanthus]
MKVLLGLVLCSLISASFAQSHASALIRGMPVRRFFERWYPKGMPPFTDFTYTLNTTPDMVIELHCPAIYLFKPCSEYMFKIHDGDDVKVICGTTKKYFYTSKSNKLAVQVITGKKPMKNCPKCSARPIKKT